VLGCSSIGIRAGWHLVFGGSQRATYEDTDRKGLVKYRREYCAFKSLDRDLGVMWFPSPTSSSMNARRSIIDLVLSLNSGHHIEYYDFLFFFDENQYYDFDAISMSHSGETLLTVKLFRSRNNMLTRFCLTMYMCSYHLMIFFNTLFLPPCNLQCYICRLARCPWTV
jgi:hypothetical protein